MMRLDQDGRRDWKLDACRLVWLVACAVSFATYVLYAIRKGGFSNDDLDNFRLVQALDLKELMGTPIDVHWVPLHRALSWFVYAVSPMNYCVAVMVMAVLHAVSAVALYRALLLVSDRPVARAFVLCYLSSVMIAFGMMWWASAQHRMTYVCLDMVFIVCYLHWLQVGKHRYLVVCALAMLTSLGFYEKGVLMPFHVFVLVLALHADAGIRQLIRKLAPVLLLGGLGLAYVALYLSRTEASHSLDLAKSLMAILLSLKTQASGALGLLFDPVHQGSLLDNRVRSWLIAATWLALIIWTSARSKKNILIWLGLLVVLVVDHVPSAISSRVSDFGLGYFEYYRFQYEEFHLVVLFTAVAMYRAVSKMGAHGWGSRQLRRSWALLCVALVFAVLNLLALHQAARINNDLTFFAQSHAYMRNLLKGTRPLRDQQANFEIGPVPKFLSIFGSIKDTQLLLPLFVPDVRFDSPAYRVDESGAVSRISPDD